MSARGIEKFADNINDSLENSVQDARSIYAHQMRDIRKLGNTMEEIMEHGKPAKAKVASAIKTMMNAQKEQLEVFSETFEEVDHKLEELKYKKRGENCDYIVNQLPKWRKLIQKLTIPETGFNNEIVAEVPPQIDEIVRKWRSYSGQSDIEERPQRRMEKRAPKLRQADEVPAVPSMRSTPVKSKPSMPVQRNELSGSPESRKKELIVRLDRYSADKAKIDDTATNRIIAINNEIQALMVRKAFLIKQYADAQKDYELAFFHRKYEEDVEAAEQELSENEEAVKKLMADKKMVIKQWSSEMDALEQTIRKLRDSVD